MGGTPKRMETFAHFIMEEIGYKLPTGTELSDISQFSYRYSMYKVSSILLRYCIALLLIPYNGYQSHKENFQT